ncbi:uncharacterized protein LOC128864305 isoform X1 [Anastrepha ludens]|uniref:uncharacterized protein LOC128864305 isoform X1 n=2 Tax=Anastrepha ludens TaxID=28586 RepID=UPI0023B0E045|nr:uncharacterized protein LOC128864305 isoform X1 [Anastrepha ludens]
MQQSRNSNKQQQLQKQPQRRRFLHASAQNVFSQSRLSASINNKLAANKAGCEATAAAVPRTDAADPSIRNIRFRTQICNTIKNNNNNKHDNNGNIRATSKAQDTSGTNSSCDGSGDATATEAHPSAAQQEQWQQQQFFQLPPKNLEYYELKCRINYGDFRQVHVQFHSSDRRCCAFSWKRKFRRCSTTAQRQRQHQRKHADPRYMRRRSGVWLTTCQQRSRHNSLLSTSETQLNCDEEYTSDGVEEVAKGSDEDADADVVNKTLVHVDNEVIDSAKDAKAVAVEMSTRVNVGERVMSSNTEAADYCECDFINGGVTESHKPTVTDVAAVAGVVAGVDLIDFAADNEVVMNTFTATDADARTSVTDNALAITSDAVAEVETVTDIQSTVTHSLADANSGVRETNQIGSDVSSTLLIAAEVSGDLLVGDGIGVDSPKKVNQIVDISNEWIARGCASVQLTTECGGDQNRGIGSAVNKNAKHTDAPTELHEINHNNNNSITTTTVTNGTTTTTTTRTNSQTPSPILGHHGKKSATSTTTGSSATVLGGTLLEKKSQSKLLSVRGKALLPKSHQQQRSAEEAPVPATGVAERLDATELQRLKHLNRHSCNGRLDYEAIERHLEQTELQEEHRNKGIEALGVLLQYAVFNLDAFACPRVKTEKHKIEERLSTTLKLLDEAKTNCAQLQDQLCEKEGYYLQREQNLQAFHRCELDKEQANLADYQAFAQEKFNVLESQLEAKNLEHKRIIESFRLELSQKKQELCAADERETKLKERFSALEISEQELREKLKSTENSYATHLKVATERQEQCHEHIKIITKEVETLRASNENRERELRDKLNLSQEEISVLRSSQRSFNESLDRSSGISSPRNSSTSEFARLESEVDSLHCVLELKQKEISKLIKQNEKLMRDAEERAVLTGKISKLESMMEMLKSELDIKSEKEKDFLRQIDDMQKAYNHEMVKRKRLSYDNEALQWQLKQRSEQLHIVETKLHELSAMESHNASTQSSIHSLNRSQLMNGSSMASIQMDDFSPPTSPVVKGVIEKPDSVSWVLEMDDDTPEAAASKMVKRAGSFRSVERSPSTRRQLSGGASAMNTSLSSVGSGASYGNGNSSGGPNPLSQSMSATTVIRHSSDVRTEFSKRPHSRTRSKSVSVKGTEPVNASAGALSTGSVGTKSGKRLLRQSSSSSAWKQHQLELINWKEPVSSSSPHQNAIHPRTSTLCSEIDEELVLAGRHDDSFFPHTPNSSAAARKLITCDTSKLNSGERLDMQSLPTHASVHDLKKKFHEIQESAGEAMVSGTNSEDESCSASSDDACSASTSSATTGSTSSLKNSHISLEDDVILFDKINSLNGTPMEVSWSDDTEIFANGSTV